MSIADKLTQIAENEQKVYDAGCAAGIAQHMRDYIRRCNAQRNFLYAFAGIGWNDTATSNWIATYVPPEDLVLNCATNSSYMYAYSGIKDTKVPIDICQATGNVKSTFVYAQNLVTIHKLIVSETTPGLNFTNCRKLTNINVEGVIGTGWNLSASPLGSDSVQNIIDCLKDLTGADTLTLTLHADVGAALTDVQKAAITAKNWTLAY